jgi:hypothetical protein
MFQYFRYKRKNPCVKEFLIIVEFHCTAVNMLSNQQGFNSDVFFKEL